MKFERIRNLREDSDMTQQQIAVILQVRQQTYSNYENGARNIPIEVFWQLADLYHTNVDYLIGRSDKK